MREKERKESKANPIMKKTQITTFWYYVLHKIGIFFLSFAIHTQYLCRRKVIIEIFFYISYTTCVYNIKIRLYIRKHACIYGVGHAFLFSKLMKS